MRWSSFFYVIIAHVYQKFPSYLSACCMMLYISEPSRTHQKGSLFNRKLAFNRLEGRSEKLNQITDAVPGTFYHTGTSDPISIEVVNC